MFKRLLRHIKNLFGFGDQYRVIDVQKKIIVRTRDGKLRRLSRIFVRIRRK